MGSAQVPKTSCPRNLKRLTQHVFRQRALSGAHAMLECGAPGNNTSRRTHAMSDNGAVDNPNSVSCHSRSRPSSPTHECLANERQTPKHSHFRHHPFPQTPRLCRPPPSSGAWSRCGISGPTELCICPRKHTHAVSDTDGKITHMHTTASAHTHFGSNTCTCTNARTPERRRNGTITKGQQAPVSKQATWTYGLSSKAWVLPIQSLRRSPASRT